MSMALADDYAYIPARNTHLQILDISDPDNPTHALTVPLNCFPYHASVIGDRLFLCTFDEEQMTGVMVLDIHERLNPVEMAYYAFPGTVQDVILDGPYHVIATGASLLVLRTDAADATDGDARDAHAVAVLHALRVLQQTARASGRDRV